MPGCVSELVSQPFVLLLVVTLGKGPFTSLAKGHL